jgi:hypothetical protein
VCNLWYFNCFNLEFYLFINLLNKKL